jgi:hypothetical protein
MIYAQVVINRPLMLTLHKRLMAKRVASLNLNGLAGWRPRRLPRHDSTGFAIRDPSRAAADQVGIQSQRDQPLGMSQFRPARIRPDNRLTMADLGVFKEGRQQLRRVWRSSERLSPKCFPTCMGKPHRCDPPRAIPRRPNHHHHLVTEQTGGDGTPLAIISPRILSLRDPDPRTRCPLGRNQFRGRPGLSLVSPGILQLQKRPDAMGCRSGAVCGGPGKARRDGRAEPTVAVRASPVD